MAKEKEKERKEKEKAKRDNNNSAPSRGKGKGRSESALAGGNRSDSKGRAKGVKGTSKGGGKQSPRPRSPGPGVRGSVQGQKYVPANTRKHSRGRSPSGKQDCPQCIDNFYGRCNKGTNCDYWHISDCRFYQQGTCTAGNDCIFYHRDKNGKVINGAKIGAACKAGAKAKARNKAKAKAKADGSAGVCLLVSSPNNPSNTLVCAVTAVSFSPLEQ